MRYRGQGQSARATSAAANVSAVRSAASSAFAGSAHEERNQVFDVAAIKDRERPWL
jgi:hypothetical protein